MPITKLCRVIRALDPILPISFKLEQSLRSEGRSRVWYSTQQEHWLGWLSEYDGPGTYGRANGKRSAEFVYNHIRCPEMLAWFAEATGISDQLVRLACKRVAGRAGQSGAQCAAFRQVVPWELIEERIAGRGKTPNRERGARRARRAEGQIDGGEALALSVRQPWAWAIIHAGKNVENKSEAGIRQVRRAVGRSILIHAGKALTLADYRQAAKFIAKRGATCPPFANLPRGGVVGVVTVKNVVDRSASPWFTGPYGLVLVDPRPCKFVPARGQLGLFRVEAARRSLAKKRAEARRLSRSGAAQEL